MRIVDGRDWICRSWNHTGKKRTRKKGKTRFDETNKEERRDGEVSEKNSIRKMMEGQIECAACPDQSGVGGRVEGAGRGHLKEQEGKL